MKLWFVSVAALAFVLPIYGQEKSLQPARNKADASKPTQSTPQPAPPTVNVINQQAPNTEENRPKAHPDSYLRRLFSPENLPNIGLFIAGIAAIIVALCTLGVIRRQTEATEIAAKAAEASVKSIISKERARLWVEPSEEMADMQRGLMLFKVCFSGSTDATIKESGTYAVVTRSKEPPLLPEHIPPMSLPKIITPTDERLLHVANVMGEVPAQQDVFEGSQFLHFAGFIKYTDVFQPKEWTRKFRYLWRSSKIHGINGAWIECGEPEDNQET